MKFYKNKTILVTGATGLIGNYLINQLMYLENVYIIALSRNENKLKELYSKYLCLENFKIIARDISLELPTFDRNIDIIFHAASPISGSTINNEPVDIIKPNINGTINCLEFLKKQLSEKNINGRLVIFSSATLYYNDTAYDKIVCEEDTNITDYLDSNTAPYSESKRIVEVIAKAYQKQFNVDCVIARLSYVYGYSYFMPKTAFYEFIEKAINGENIIINNTNICRRDNIYISDAVDAILKICEYGKSAQSYNISSNQELNNYIAIDEIGKIIVDTVNEIKGSNVEIKYIKEDATNRKPGIILDNTKTKSLGWEIKTSIFKGIRKIIEEYLEKCNL